MWPIHFNLPPTQQSAYFHKQPYFARPSPQVHMQQCFSGPSVQPHKLPAISRPSLPKSLIPRPMKGKPSLARLSVLSRPPLPHHLDCPHIFCVHQVLTRLLLCSQVKKTFFLTCPPLSHSPVFVQIRKL